MKDDESDAARLATGCLFARRVLSFSRAFSREL
jgi:hypothetical protein